MNQVGQEEISQKRLDKRIDEFDRKITALVEFAGTLYMLIALKNGCFLRKPRVKNG